MRLFKYSFLFLFFFGFSLMDYQKKKEKVGENLT